MLRDCCPTARSCFVKEMRQAATEVLRTCHKLSTGKECRQTWGSEQEEGEESYTPSVGVLGWILRQSLHKVGSFWNHYIP